MPTGDTLGIDLSTGEEDLLLERARAKELIEGKKLAAKVP
jgi:hypothetical protein